MIEKLLTPFLMLYVILQLIMSELFNKLKPNDLKATTKMAVFVVGGVIITSFLTWIVSIIIGMAAGIWWFSS